MAPQTLVSVMLAQQEAQLVIDALRGYQRELVTQDLDDGKRAKLTMASLIETLLRGNLAAVRMGG